MIKKLIKSLVLSILGIATSFSQHQVEGSLQLPQKEGLNKIMISHTLRAYAKPNLGDLRIYDSNKHQVPYYLEQAITNIEKDNFKAFDIISSSKVKDSNSTYVFLNPKKTLKQVVLQIANYSGFKYYNILGSNDLKQWYGITNKQYLSNLNNISNTEVYKSISFPLCSYKYLKIVFNDVKTLPINLLNVGQSTQNSKATIREQIPISNFEIIPLKTAKKTQIKIEFTIPEIVNSIDLKINAPEFYNRKAILYYLKPTKKDHKEILEKQLVKRFYFNSSQNSIIDFSDTKAKIFYIEITNQDNPALSISKANCYQNSLFAVANLKKAEKYTITSGSPSLNKPKYDIAFFKNNTTLDTPILKIKETTLIKTPKPTKATLSFWQQKWFLWLAIGLAVLIVGFVVSGLLKDLKNTTD